MVSFWHDTGLIVGISDGVDEGITGEPISRPVCRLPGASCDLHVLYRRFFAQAFKQAPRPSEVTTDRAPAYLRVLDEVLPEALHVVEQYAHSPIEADHGQLKSRLRPMRGLKRLRSVQVISLGNAFVQNLRDRKSVV